jgi:hypothetical protein
MHMSDSHSDAEKSAGPGYGLPNKAAPLPRQWQMPPPQTPMPVPRSQTGLQHFYPGSSGPLDWHQAPPRRMERAILVGVWLLVMLAAIAIGLRMLDLSAMQAPSAETPARPLASEAAANAMRSAVLAAARPRDSDPFDDAASDLPPPLAPLPEPLPVPPPTPALKDTPPRPAARLTPAATLTAARAAAPAPAPAVAPAPPPPVPVRQASGGPPCPDALRAMQLCPDQK